MPTDREINNEIQAMILEQKSMDSIIRFVKGNCQSINLTPMTLGMLFEVYAGVRYDENDPTSCFSKPVPIAELKNIHPSFESTNGCQWARSNSGYLGKRYKIKRPRQNGKVAAVQLDGPNRNSVKRYRGIRQDIRNSILSQACAVLDVRSSLEVDHKNGRYEELSNITVANQKIEDFQPLSKVAAGFYAARGFRSADEKCTIPRAYTVKFPAGR